MKNNFYILVTFLLIGVNYSVRAQDTLSSTYVEKRTYELFLAKDWKELIEIGELAVNEGYDYFNLRMRIGMAYFEKENYLAAEKHFEKALCFSDNDKLVLEYLYFCKLFTGQQEECRILSASFPNDLIVKMGLKEDSPIYSISVEGAKKISNNLSYDEPDDEGDGTFFNPASYFQVGLKHGVKNRLSLFHAVSFFGQETSVGKVKQAQYYLNGTIPLKNKWSISPAFHLVNTNFSGVAYVDETAYEFNTKNNYFVGSMELRKSIGMYKLSLGTTYSNTSDVNQFYHYGTVIYSPRGNNKLLLGLTTYLHTNDSYASSYTAFSPFVYLQPLKRIGFKLSYFHNRGNNVIEDNGSFINNSQNLTKARYGANLYFVASKNITLFGIYQFESKEQRVPVINYQYNLFLAGIKISPSVFK